MGTTDDRPAGVELFRRKPLTVETMLWDGTHESGVALAIWTDDAFRWTCPAPGAVRATLWVEHSGARTPIPVGHRIVRESNGNGFYPISPEAVAATYEPVVDA